MPLYLSLLGIMALVGLWHGAGWGFILWGVLHGSYLLVFRAWEEFQQKRFPALAERIPHKLFWRAFTLVAVIAAWIPFRAETLQQSGIMLRSMLGFSGITTGVSYSIGFYLTLAALVLFCAIEPVIGNWITKAEHKVIDRKSVWVPRLLLLRPVVYALALLLFMIFDERDTQFIYFQF
jgi:D-alanyl-lipoteichoic acid acyltransferase DltB (MBOAT superfamily)